MEKFGNGKAHMKCCNCDYEVLQDSLWYINNYDDDKNGWFTCPKCNKDTFSVIEDYVSFKTYKK